MKEFTIEYALDRVQTRHFIILVFLGIEKATLSERGGTVMNSLIEEKHTGYLICKLYPPED